MFFIKNKQKNIIDGRLNYDLIRKMVEQAEQNPNLEVKIITACREEIIIRSKNPERFHKRLDDAAGKYD